jgi:hypothetical protein
MIEVKIVNKPANEIIVLVRELRSQGLVQGKDFDFMMSSPSFDSKEHTGIQPKSAIFKFYTEKHATLFALKYGNETNRVDC